MFLLQPILHNYILVQQLTEQDVTAFLKSSGMHSLSSLLIGDH